MKRLVLFFCVLVGCGESVSLPRTDAGTSPCDACSPFAVCSIAETCRCAEGYAGDGLTCADIDECAAGLITCGAHATCANTMGSYTCGDCPPGHQSDGDACHDIDECTALATPCAGDMRCENAVGTYTCTCPAGHYFDGTRCADFDECGVAPSPCDARAECINDVGGYHCGPCPRGFGGDGVTCTACTPGLGDGMRCDVDIDECEEGLLVCGAHALCENTYGSAGCICEAYYEDVEGVCVEIDECATNNGGCGAPGEMKCVERLGPPVCVRLSSGLWRGEHGGTNESGANHATVHGATDRAGVRGRAFDLDGDAQHLTVDEPVAFHAPSLSATAWVYFDGLDSAGAATPGTQVVIGTRNAASGYAFLLEKVRRDGQDVFRFAVSSTAGATEVVDTRPITPGTWYHVAGVFEDATRTLRLYVNGRAVAPAVHEGALEHCTGACAAAPIEIGRALDGAIDELHLDTKALTHEEIEARIVLSFATPRLWLDAASASTLALSGNDVTQWSDRSGNGHHAIADRRPTRVTNSALGAGVAIRFDGDHLMLPSGAVPSGVQYTVLAMTARRADGLENYFLTSGAPGCVGFNDCLHVGHVANDRFRFAHFGNNLDVNVPAFSGPTPTLVLAQLHATGRRLELITPSSTYTATDASAATLLPGEGHLGYAPTQNRSYNGDLGELLIYPEALSATQRQVLQSYLRAKWFP